MTTLSARAQQAFDEGLNWLKGHLLNHAEIQFDRVLKVAPDHAETRRYRAVSVFKLGRRDEGVAALKALVAEQPDQTGAWRDLAAALRMTGAPGADEAWARSGESGPAPADLMFETETAEQGIKVVDYRYVARIRHGAGKPSHPELTTMIERGRSRYAEVLRGIETMAGDFADMPLGGTYADRAPFWFNAWFPPLDGMALTHFLKSGNPARFLEIGSGVSTKFARRAVELYGLRTCLTSIDPEPRNEVDALCDEVIRAPLEDCDIARFEALEPGDILFLDSSHRSFQGSDVTVFFTEILPRVRPGVLIHIHDIYLPDDYISGHVPRLWNEQYLLAVALLFGGDQFEVRFPSWFVHQDSALNGQAERIFRPGPLESVNLYGASFWMTKTR